MARSKTATSGTPPEKITRDDLEHKLRSFQDGIRGKLDDQRSTIVTVVGVAGLVLVVVVFLLGRRSGKRKTTVVEIRRV